MKMCRVLARQDADSEAVDRGTVSVTRAISIAKYLLADDWSVTLIPDGEAKHTPPPIRPQPASHPWKAKPSVPQFMRRGRGA